MIKFVDRIGETLLTVCNREDRTRTAQIKVAIGSDHSQAQDGVSYFEDVQKAMVKVGIPEGRNYGKLAFVGLKDYPISSGFRLDVISNGQRVAAVFSDGHFF